MPQTWGQVTSGVCPETPGSGEILPHLAKGLSAELQGGWTGPTQHVQTHTPWRGQFGKGRAVPPCSAWPLGGALCSLQGHPAACPLPGSLCHPPCCSALTWFPGLRVENLVICLPLVPQDGMRLPAAAQHSWVLHPPALPSTPRASHT